MNVFLTGGHGHLAREFIRLHGAELSITATVRREDPAAHPGATYVVAPSPEATVEMLSAGSFDAIVHLAQPSQGPRSAVEGIGLVRDEVAMFAELLRHAKTAGIRRIFLASTGGLYADDPSPLTERHRLLAPPDLDAYYAAKMAMESMAAAMFGELDLTIARFFFIYGPGQGHGKLVSRLFDSVDQGRPIRVDPDGGIRLNPIYVTDAARAVRNLVETGGSKIVNVAGSEAVSLRELASKIGAVAGKRPVFEAGGTARNLVADVSLLCTFLAEPLLALDDGLRLTAIARKSSTVLHNQSMENR